LSCEVAVVSAGAQEVVDRFERSVAADERRRAGVHYTPPALARALLDEALDVLGRLPDSICDPTCGAGSFLLAAADALHDRGVPASEVLGRLVGGELDAAAGAAAAEALRRWALDHGVREPEPLRVLVGETLLRPVDGWRGRPTGGFDLVVGNPPFLGQLSTRTSRSAAERRAVQERFPASGGYVDTAALFLLSSLDLVGDHGVVAMLQPQSFLAARDAAGVRDEVLRRAGLHALWSDDAHHFDAAVRVCAPVLRRCASDTARPVRVLWGLPARQVASAGVPVLGESWGPLLAAPHGVPTVVGAAGPRLGTVASATAGFRDEYYALRDALVDGALVDEQRPELVTVGMVEPGFTTWGEAPRRIGGRQHLTPRADLEALAAASPRVARWAAARRVPKVLVATQTRVVEAAPDPSGECLPVTPLISVEPSGDRDVWWLTAALLAPPVSARAVAQHLGAGLSAGALRWSASAVLDVQLPEDEGAWGEGAELCRDLASCEPSRRAPLLERLGRTMCRAHGLASDHEVMTWWAERVRR
jgi:hypothetical protein